MTAARAFRLTAPEPSEDEIHVTVAQFLDRFLRPPAFWFPYPAGVARLTPRQQAQFSRFGVKRGLPDIWVLYGGGLYLIELKTRRGELSKTRIVRTRKGAPRILEGQADVFPRLIQAGVRKIAICESLDQVIAELRRWEIPIRMPLKTSAEPA